MTILLKRGVLVALRIVDSYGAKECIVITRGGLVDKWVSTKIGELGENQILYKEKNSNPIPETVGYHLNHLKGVLYSMFGPGLLGLTVAV